MAKKNRSMPTFVSLFGWTDQGIRSVKDTIKRAERFKADIKKLGGSPQEIYWTMGRYDGIIIFEAPDEEAATAIMLGACSRGTVRTETLRAFSVDEMKGILKKARV
jgi:uncharacterized protein with GYD domain